MTLQEAKDKLAIQNGFVHWDEVVDDHKAEYFIDQVAELYARSKWDEACDAQRESCSFEYMKIDVYDHSNKFETIDREIGAIKNAPKPEFNP